MPAGKLLWRFTFLAPQFPVSQFLWRRLARCLFLCVPRLIAIQTVASGAADSQAFDGGARKYFLEWQRAVKYGIVVIILTICGGRNEQCDDCS
jgi:hypothetical protein